MKSSNRRQFLRNVLPAGAFFCLGCNPLFARADKGEKSAQSSQKHKFLDNSALTYKQVYEFAYKIHTIPLLKKMSQEMGKDKLIEMLQSLSTEVFFETQELWEEVISSVFWTHVITREIIEETETDLKYNVVECLWASTFLESDAGDLGYALFCQPDFARAKVMHRKLNRAKTLMQGDDFCDFHFELLE